MPRPDRSVATFTGQPKLVAVHQTAILNSFSIGSVFKRNAFGVTYEQSG
ncbi:MAG TPA: hypothetical protein VHS31_11225 [Tepidisphaeraceae bacterium]|nr:hypothetical protein [Tepidisphaeraceae bacterium]